MIQIRNAYQAVTEAHASDILKLPAVKLIFRWRLWILSGIVAIAGIRLTINYRLLTPQTGNPTQSTDSSKKHKLDVNAEVTGQVEEKAVQKQSVSKKKQRLSRLSNGEIEAQLATAATQVKVTEKREAVIRQQILLLENWIAYAWLNLQQSKEETAAQLKEAEELISTAQSSLRKEQTREAEAKALLEQKQADLNRLLYLSKIVSGDQQRVDQAQIDLGTAYAALQSQRLAIKAARQAVATTQRNLAQIHRRTLNPNTYTNRLKAYINRLTAQLKRLKVRLFIVQTDAKKAAVNQQLMQNRLNNLTIVTPVNGTVLKCNVNPGITMSPDSPILQILDLNQIYQCNLTKEKNI